VLTTPGCVKIADVATSAARILNGVAEGATSLAGLMNTEGSWDRREQEWKHQVDIITLEIEQIKRQILSSERHRATALRELNNHQRQQEHAEEVLDFLRDKFTKQELYLFLQQETAALYKQAYSLALKAAKAAQQAFWYERGDTRQDFLREVSWNSLHEGLMAGERLDLSLHSMDQAYMDLNCREYELSKNFSLRLHFPLAFLELKACGSCESKSFAVPFS
jgi:chromosome segregation ATPase